MQGPFLRKYGVECKIPFTLFETDGVDFKVDAAHASGDTKIMKDEGTEANTTNGFVDEGQGYSITLSATEMQAARIVVYVVDQGTKAWLDTAIVIDTYGHASAMHGFDLDTASTAQTGDSYGVVNSGTHGNAALKTLIDTVDTVVDGIKTTTDALPNSGALTDLSTDLTFLVDIITNKKEIYKDGSVWKLRVRNSGDTADILNKELKDKDGNNIGDLAATRLAKELASTV